jgi:serine/threonine protein kinase
VIVLSFTATATACMCCRQQHRDLKLDNILFEHSGPGADIKLVDFGLSCHFSDAQMEHDVVGTWVSCTIQILGCHPGVHTAALL